MLISVKSFIELQVTLHRNIGNNWSNITNVMCAVNMTENKTLNLRNNVKDNAKAVEVSESGIEKNAQTVTFLACDILKNYIFLCFYTEQVSDQNAF